MEDQFLILADLVNLAARKNGYVPLSLLRAFTLIQAERPTHRTPAPLPARMALPDPIKPLKVFMLEHRNAYFLAAIKLAKGNIMLAGKLIKISQAHAYRLDKELYPL